MVDRFGIRDPVGILFVLIFFYLPRVGASVTTPRYASDIFKCIPQCVGDQDPFLFGHLFLFCFSLNSYDYCCRTKPMLAMLIKATIDYRKGFKVPSHRRLSLEGL